jgi:hypothetical protein
MAYFIQQNLISYICDHAEFCTKDCRHKVPHLPSKEEHWLGFCDEVPVECGENMEISCLCVPFNSDLSVS